MGDLPSGEGKAPGPLMKLLEGGVPGGRLVLS